MKTKRLKHLVVINGKVLEETTDPDLLIHYIDIRSVGRGVLLQEPQEVSFGDAPSRARRIVQRGDTIISTVRTYLRAVWPVGGSTDDLVVSTGFAVLTPGPEIAPRYLGWLVQSDIVVEEVVSRSVGVSYPAINANEIGDIRVPLPDLVHQNALANYLDAETARIDSLIERHQRLRSLAEERIRSIVTNSVRLGLVDAPLRQDMHSWIDQVPAHWNVLPLKRIGRLRAGAAFPDEAQGQLGSPIPYFKVRDFETPGNEEFLTTSENTVTREVAARLRSPIIAQGSIVFPKIGAALLTSRRRILAADSCLDQNIMALTVTRGENRYFYYLLQTLDFGRLRMPGPVPLLNEADAANLPVPIPPGGEQQQIAGHLDRVLGPLRAVQTRSGKAVALLREHRQALITAVVIGQMNVPEVAA